MSYNVFIYPPRSVYDNENVTLHLKLDKLYMIGKESRTNSASMDGKSVFNDNVVYQNFSPPVDTGEWNFGDGYSKDLIIKSDVPSSTKINVMPGFRLSWWYTGDKVLPEPLANLKHLIDDKYIKDVTREIPKFDMKCKYFKTLH